MQESNANNNDATVVDLIRFDIVSSASVKTISPRRALPIIREAVTINGYTQSGASANTLAEGNDAVLKVQLNGANAGPVNGLVIEASESTIRGLVINRFVGIGVLITGSGATGNKVLGNYIGTDAAGSADRGNGEEGVEVRDASDNTVGGTADGARNVISGNTDDGVEFQGNTLGNSVLGNYIGTNASGTQDLGNGAHGVDFRDGAFDNAIGGATRAAGNRIAHNEQDGVSVSGINSVGNSILSNEIFSNDDLGIDLSPDGDTDNDADDPNTTEPDPDKDTGANNRQNFPVITSVVQSSFPFNPTKISGTLNSTPNQEFTIQCFAAAPDPSDRFVVAPDPSGHGEGVGFAAEDTTVTTDPNGNASFECNFFFPRELDGTVWSATATNEATGDTSEFSANFTVPVE